MSQLSIVAAAWLLSIVVAVAEPPKSAQDPVKASGPNVQVNKVPAQGQPQGQPNPNFNPNNIPNQQIPPGQQTPPGQPLPDAAAIQNPAQQSVGRDRPPRGAEKAPADVPRLQEVDALRPTRDNLGLDQLNADDARKQTDFDPARFGRGPGDMETDALVEQLRGITGKNNRERMSDTTRSYGAGIVTDPQSLLDGAGAGLAGDEPNDGLGRRTSRVRTDDGGSVDTYTRRDGSTTTITTHQNGTEICREHRYRTESGDDVYEYHSSDTHIVSIVGRDQNGRDTSVTVESRYNGRTGEWTTTTTIGGTSFGSRREAQPGHDRAYSIMGGLRRGGDVDPDSAYGKGGGYIPGHKPKDPKMVAARVTGVGPGARPDDGGRADATPQLNVDVNLVGQPDPNQSQGGSGPGYQGYNPNDFVRPPRDP